MISYIVYEKYFIIYLLTYSNGKKKILIRHILCANNILNFEQNNNIYFTSIFTYNTVFSAKIVQCSCSPSILVTCKIMELDNSFLVISHNFLFAWIAYILSHI